MSNRSELAAKLAESFQTTKADGDVALLAFTNTIVAQLKEKGEVVLPGFGRLKMQERPARAGRNPKTGEAIQIEAKSTVKFKLFPAGLKD